MILYDIMKTARGNNEMAPRKRIGDETGAILVRLRVDTISQIGDLQRARGYASLAETARALILASLAGSPAPPPASPRGQSLGELVALASDARLTAALGEVERLRGVVEQAALGEGGEDPVLAAILARAMAITRQGSPESAVRILLGMF